MNHIVKIKEKNWLSHNMMRFVLEKPTPFESKIGQAIELTVMSPELIDKPAPFTLTSLPNDDHLELMIKIFPEHHGVTIALSEKEVGDEITITDAWDSYHYQGVGTFIAGGSGITPFVPMVRNLLHRNELGTNKLIYANRNAKDIILKEEMKNALGENFINILSDENGTEYDFGQINGEFLKRKISDFDEFFYLCGPDPFVVSVKKDLIALGADEQKIQIAY